MTKRYEPELGQAVWGNPTGEYECPDFVDAFLEHVCREIERVYWNIHQKEWDEYSDPEIPNIEYRPYYWGECTCGWDDKGFDGEHQESCYQSDLSNLISQRGLDSTYGIIDLEYKTLCKKHNIPWNDGYGCAVHCTCDYYERGEKWFNENKLGEKGHTDSCPSVLPNFKFQEVEISWYKHRGRGQSINVNWDEKRWRKWLDVCLKQIRDYEEQDGRN